MSRIALAVPPIPGHMNPATTLGKELARRGHDVTVYAFLDGKEKAEATGLAFHPVGEDGFPAGEVKRRTAELGKLQGFKALRYTVTWFRASSAAWMRELPALLREHQTDLLLADQTVSGALTAGEHAGVRTIGLCNALAIHPDPNVPPFPTHWAPPRNARERFGVWLTYKTMSLLCADFHASVNIQRRRWKLKPMPIQVAVLPQFTYLSQQPAWFDLPRQMPANFHYTGPWHRHEANGSTDGSFPWDKLDGRPLIYASLGTLQNRVDETFHCIAEACEGLDSQLVIALGSKARTEMPALPGNPIVVPFAPQVALLKRASLVITHAGLNTALETLAAGVPMVALPITNDQPGVAARLRHLGVAKVIPIAALKAAHLRAAVQEMLANTEAKRRTQEFAQRIRETDGIAAAADLVEGQIKSGLSTAQGRSG
ncbi:glycosyltransferase [Roseimicrobium sp. ORNL1]|uniref:glycosyltransferase n=1 Tax=Roseimicrobium sp. ORNL1 TaxID=2711231 RepID=UPI0013E1B160|nr:glycosyltransferase [Roseimicrobium sp. ORNL1]QIF03023.1 glycosyltransferase [Roseimicrobium sp. ORNL1]